MYIFDFDKENFNSFYEFIGILQKELFQEVHNINKDSVFCIRDFDIKYREFDILVVSLL